MDSENKKQLTQMRDASIYHFDEACQLLLEVGETVSLEELQQRFKRRYGVKPRAETIAHTLRQIEVQHGISPLNTYFEIKQEYFDKIVKNRPNTSPVWNKYRTANPQIDNEPPINYSI